MATDVAPGFVIDGRYELLSLLGTGGFGVVYKAKQLNTGQLVAIKIARSLDDHPGSSSSSGVAARFEREMNVVAELSHPNIVQLMDKGQLPDKRLFAVLQLVHGVSLSELLKREGPMAPTEAKRLMMQVLDALCSAHDLGVIHRDLKPANIMVTHVGALRNALVLDFGIATFTKGNRDDSYQSLTPAGSVGGTPAYMAPEQLHGKAPNPQTDIYAWGLVFLECLTGQRVVRGSSIAETMFTHLRPDPHPLPSAVAMHPLGRVLRSALAKDPSNRYRDARVALREVAPCDVSSLRKMPRAEPEISIDGDTAVQSTEKPSSASESRRRISATGLGPWITRSTRDIESVKRGEATPSPSHNVLAERRQLTAMACELGPLSVLSASLDPDELYSIIGEFRRISNAAVRHLDGIIDRWEGGRMIGYFGYPVAHEDDASRAVQAALEIIAATSAADFDMPDSEIPLGVQIGIHTGQVVASNIHLGQSGEVSIVGDASRIAVRLQESADPGVAILSETVHVLVRDRFECVPHGRCDLGAQGSVASYRAIGAHKAHVTGESVEHGRLVGRDSEVGTLRDRWDEVMEGRGQVILVSGEAGIGKSRLTHAFRQSVHEDGHLWLECASSPYLRASAFHPIIHALQLLFGFQRDETAAEKRAKVAAFLRKHKLDCDRFGDFFAVLLEIEETRESDGPPAGGLFRQPIEEQLLDFVFTLAENKPVVVGIEDLHWTDPSSLEFIHQLVDQVPLGPVLVLATTRPSYMPEWRSRSHVTPMPLSRLSRKRVESMIRSVAGDKVLPDELVAHLAAKTDGVPLFVEELTKVVLESDAVIEHDDRYELAGDLGSLAIPASLRGSLMARLDRLGAVKELAQIAAIVGREFSFSLLESVCEMHAVDLSRSLAQLVHSELVIQRGRPPKAKYIFKHALVQDTAYSSLLPKTRRRYHARIGEVLEEKFPEVTQSQPELLAHHYTEGKCHDKAIDFWLRAGTRATERSAYVESIQHLTRGLEILRKTEESRARDEKELQLTMSLGAPLMLTKGYGAPEIEKNFSRALDICRKLGAAEEHIPSMWGLWVFYQVRAEYQNALELGEQLDQLAERSGDPELALSAHQAYGASLLLTGEYTRGRDHFERGLALYDPDKHGHMAFIYGQDPGMYCHIFMAWVLFAQGFPDKAVNSAETSIAVARKVEHPSSIAFAMCMGLPVFEQCGALERVRELSQQAMEVCGEYRLIHWLAFASFMNGLAHAFLSDLSEGIEKMRGALGMWRATGARTILPYFHSLLAERLGEQGNVSEALEVQAEVPSTNVAGLETFFEPTWQRTRAGLLVKRDHGDDRERALELLELAARGARERGDCMAEMAALTDLIALLQRRGTSWEEPLARLGELVESITEGIDTPIVARARRATGGS